jgi:hypothetical protein
MINNCNENMNNNSSEENTNDSKKKTRNRPSKREIYKNEREELIKELEKKIGLNEETRGVLLNDLEKNEELKEYLLEKVEEIRKMYKTGNWNYFVKQHNKEQSEISLLKSIYKDEKYKLITKRKLVETGGEKKQVGCMYFYKTYELTEKYVS